MNIIAIWCLQKYIAENIDCCCGSKYKIGKKPQYMAEWM